MVPKGNALKGTVSKWQERGRYAAGKQLKCPCLLLRAVAVVGAKQQPGEGTEGVRV